MKTFLLLLFTVSILSATAENIGLFLIKNQPKYNLPLMKLRMY